MTSNSNFPLSAPSAQQQSQEKLSVRKELVRQLSHFINSSDYRFGVMAVTPGGGKTYSTSKVFLEFCDQDPSFIGFLAENTNDRVDEELKKISEDFYFEPVVPIVIRGRTKDLDSPGSCQNHPEAKKIGLSGHSIKRILCQSLCQFKDQCQISGYLSQFNDNGEGGFYLAPYESAINWAANHGIPNIIVFDENPMRVSNLKHEFNTQDLFQFREKINHLVSFSDEQYDFLFTFLSSVEMLINKHGRSSQDFDYKRGIEVRESFFECIQKSCGNQNIISIFNPKDELENEIFHLRRKWREELDNCLEWSARIANTDLLLSTSILDVFDSLSFPPPHSEITLNKKGRKTSLQINRFKNVIDRIPDETKILILDAFADKKTYKEFLNNSDEIEFFKHEIEFNLESIQIPKNTSQTKMRKFKVQDLENLFRWFFIEFKPQSLLIYSYKDEIEPYPGQIGRLKDVVERIKPLDLEIEYSWFFADRGTNEYTEYESVMIFGQACPNIDELISELNARYDDQISNEKDENGEYKDERFYRELVAKQHHEILQCIHRVRPINGPKIAYLFYSDSIEIEGLEIDKVINYQEVATNLITPERMMDFEIYSSLVNGVVNEIGFYAIKFQSDLELMKVLIKNAELVENMERLISSSQYGRSFSKNNGKRIRRHLEEIISELNLAESKLKIFQQGSYVKTIKTFGLESNKVYRLELTTGEIY